jgi:hypothetical protein
VKNQTAPQAEVPTGTYAEFIPAGDTDRLQAVQRRDAEKNHKRLGRVRARGGERFILLGTEHVYVDRASGRHVPASEAPAEAFVEGWELAGFLVHSRRRNVDHFDPTIRDPKRLARTRELRAARELRVARERGRAPREARNDRRRGSRRGERATASSSDDPDPEPAARPCACGCGRPRRPELPRPARDYFSDECGRRHARDRQAKSRHTKRARVLAERPGVDRHRRDPYEQLAPHEFEALRKRVNEGCGCNGSRLLVDSPDHCSACGHETVPPQIATHGDRGEPARTFVNAPAPKRKTPRLGDGSRKLEFTDEHGERRRLTDEGVVAA